MKPGHKLLSFRAHLSTTYRCRLTTEEHARDREGGLSSTDNSHNFRTRAIMTMKSLLLHLQRRQDGKCSSGLDPLWSLWASPNIRHCKYRYNWKQAECIFWSWTWSESTVIMPLTQYPGKKENGNCLRNADRQEVQKRGGYRMTSQPLKIPSNPQPSRTKYHPF